MQISGQPGRCPFPHLHGAAQPELSAPKTIANPERASGPFHIDEVMCPILKTGVREGRIKVDEDGNATGLNGFLQEDLKIAWGLRQVFVKGGKSATDTKDAPGDTINFRNLRGSSLDHTADSQILRDGFSQERLDWALSFSSDGERLTLADLGKFQQQLLKEEPGLKGKFVGGMEYAAVVSVFGRSDGQGQRFIKNDDFISLFRENKFPEGWDRAGLDTTGFWDVGASAVEFFRDHPGTLRDPGQSFGRVSRAYPGDPSPQAATPASAAVCPFKHGQEFDLADAAKHHADKLQ